MQPAHLNVDHEASLFLYLFTNYVAMITMGAALNLLHAVFTKTSLTKKVFNEMK